MPQTPTKEEKPEKPSRQLIVNAAFGKSCFRVQPDRLQETDLEKGVGKSGLTIGVRPTEGAGPLLMQIEKATGKSDHT
jgi:hypothetical protein